MDNALTKEDMAKIMMGRTQELNHLPAKAYGIFKDLSQMFNG